MAKSEPTAAEQAPSPEDMQKAQQVAEAGAAAAAETETPNQADVAAAMRDKRDEVQFAQMSDDDIEKIAGVFTNKVVASLEQRGAFEPPPEPVQPPQPIAPPEPGQPPSEQPAVPPRKLTWADRNFFGMK